MFILMFVSMCVCLCVFIVCVCVCHCACVHPRVCFPPGVWAKRDLGRKLSNLSRASSVVTQIIKVMKKSVVTQRMKSVATQRVQIMKSRQY